MVLSSFSSRPLFGALVVFALFSSIVSLAIIEVESRHCPIPDPGKIFFPQNKF